MFQKMKLMKVILLNALNRHLRPAHIYSRGQIITFLPGETVLVSIRICPRKVFCPQQAILSPSSSPPSMSLCYLLKNTRKKFIKIRNASLYTLLKTVGIKHNILFLSKDAVFQLHKKWLRGYRVWYSLRKHFLMTQHFYPQ
jgi:hypothetical protein